MMKKSFLIGYASGIVVASVAAFFLLVNASTSTEVALGDFMFTDLNGNAIDLEKLHGKAVVVNVWATWCPPCIKEMPTIENAEKALGNDNVVFLIASDEPVEKIAQFREKRKFNLPFCNFQLKKSSQLITEARPQTYIFNKKGKLVYNRMGAFEWDDKAILKRLQSYLE